MKARVAPLKERIDKLKSQLELKTNDESEAKSKIRELTGQVKLKDEEVTFYKKEVKQKNEEKSEVQTKL